MSDSIPGVLLKFVQPVSEARASGISLHWQLFKLCTMTKARRLKTQKEINKLEKSFICGVLKLPRAGWKRFQAEYGQAVNKEEWLLALFEATPLPKPRKPKPIQLFISWDDEGPVLETSDGQCFRFGSKN